MPLQIYRRCLAPWTEYCQFGLNASQSHTCGNKETVNKVVDWQSRPLNPIYPIVYLACIVLKIRQGKQVIN